MGDQAGPGARLQGAVARKKRLKSTREGVDWAAVEVVEGFEARIRRIWRRSASGRLWNETRSGGSGT